MTIPGKEKLLIIFAKLAYIWQNISFFLFVWLAISIFCLFLEILVLRLKK